MTISMIGIDHDRAPVDIRALFAFTKKKMEVKSIRGNLQTRLQKLDNGEYSGLILAAAGLNALALEIESAGIFQRMRCFRQQVREFLLYREDGI